MLLAGFVCLLFDSKTRFAASVFLLGWAVYLVVFIDATSTYKYIACATIEASIAFALNKRHVIVAYLGYSLIFVNIYGLALINNKVGPISYDVIYAIISVTQFMFLLARAVPNGINRLPAKHCLVRLVNFDSRQTRGIMYKSKTKTETNK